MAINVTTGTIIPYAGEIDEAALTADGWLPCDGRSIDKSDYPLLFNLIGTSNGGNGAPKFNLPDLRGKFVRGTDDGRGVDPDAKTRLPGAPGGSGGDSPGSLQLDATALPAPDPNANTDTGASFTSDSQGDHEHSAPHLPTQEYKCAAAITGNKGAKWNSGDVDPWSDGDHSHAVGGGDAETRPVNTYLNWIIKFKPSNDDATFPVGAVVAFAADAKASLSALATAGWLPCRGGTKTTASQPALFAAIGNTWGGDATNFTLPDLRGVFLRGVAEGAVQADSKPVDPDEHTRIRADGSFGSGVGTQQNPATALPTTPFTLKLAGMHQHTADHLPNDKYIENAAVGHSVTDYGDVKSKSGTAGAHVHTVSDGGDDETRPVNLYVDFIIKAAQQA